MRYAIAIMLMVGLSGCSQTLKSENAQLKSRVSALETQVADLRAQNAKLAASAQTPLAIDGLKLEPPKLGELRFTPAAPGLTRTYTGPTHYIGVEGGYANGVTISQNLIGSGQIGAGTLIIRNETAFTGSNTWQKAPATMTTTTPTTTTPAITPQK